MERKMRAQSIPQGWYFCGESKDIRAGQVVSKKLFGKKVVLWRTKSGSLSVSDSVCPHLGSDLGKLGSVKGENLQCFSHDYTYNEQGDCVATGFKDLPCRTKRS
jgi:phenylpropionate dioxygenase-like ring-hydroxylating dioxygenase large terminal subunit